MNGKKFCPQCQSTEVYMEVGGVTGRWKCRECKYSGIMPELELIGNEDMEESAS